MNNVRVHLYVSGRVQGVFFRHHTMKKAAELGLRGWVKNLPDGKVEAVIEGDPHSVDEMVSWCRSGPPSAHVSNLEVTREETTQEFDSFTIRYS